MPERIPIFSKGRDNQKIGYIEDSEAFDLLGKKRSYCSPKNRQSSRIDSGRTIGHVSLTCHFVGASRIADELFPQPHANTALPTSPEEPASTDPTETPLSSDAEPALETVRITLAMKLANTKQQTANDVAKRMREHLAGLRKLRPRVRGKR